jgi:hypothetical protein
MCKYNNLLGFADEETSLAAMTDSDMDERPADMPSEMKIVAWAVSLNNVGEPQGNYVDD